MNIQSGIAAHDTEHLGMLAVLAAEQSDADRFEIVTWPYNKNPEQTVEFLNFVAGRDPVHRTSCP